LLDAPKIEEDKKTYNRKKEKEKIRKKLKNKDE